MPCLTSGVGWLLMVPCAGGVAGSRGSVVAHQWKGERPCDLATLMVEVVLPGAGGRAGRTVGRLLSMPLSPDRRSHLFRERAAAEWGLFKNKHLACLLACLCLPPSDSIHAFSACFVVEPQRLCLSLLDRAIGGNLQAVETAWKAFKKVTHTRAQQVLWPGGIGHHQFAGLFGGVVGHRSRLTKVLLPPSSRSIIAINMKGCLRRAEWIKAVGPVGSRGELRPFWTITSRSSKSSQLARGASQMPPSTTKRPPGP